MDINEFAKEIHKNAVAHGWWEEDRSVPEIIALCHSELSEALEEYRKGREGVYYTDTMTEATMTGPELKVEMVKRFKPEGLPVEFADCIIRILDYCGRAGIDIESVIRQKHEYNKSRPYKHGGLKC